MKDNKQLHKLLTSDLANKLFNLLLGLTYLWFVAKNTAVMLNVGFKFSIFMFILFNAVIVVLAFTRRAPKETSTSLKDYIIALIGTYTSLLFVGTSNAEENTIITLLQMFGLIVSLTGLLYLRRSFGIVAANRGIVTEGIYKYIRHPLYAGYLLQFICTIIQNFSIHNLVVLVVATFFEIWRLVLEEKLLSRDKEYKSYTKKVKWRLLPYVW